MAILDSFKRFHSVFVWPCHSPFLEFICDDETTILNNIDIFLFFFGYYLQEGDVDIEGENPDKKEEEPEDYEEYPVEEFFVKYKN